MEPDVLVVGAGPAGTAVSMLLARQGYHVLLVDRAAFPRDKACAEYLSPACNPLLDHLGVLAAVLAASPQRLQGVRITNYRGHSCWGHFLHHGQPLYGLALPRLVLDQLLLQQACGDGVEIRTGFWVRQPLLEGRRVCGVRGHSVGGQETIRAKLVIAADGLHSILGRRLGLIQQVRWLKHVAFVTHYAGVLNVQPYGEMFLIPQGYIGLAPVGNDLVNVSVVLHASRVVAASDRPEELFEQILHAHQELHRRFVQAVRVKKLLTVGPMAQHTRCPQHDGILFVGDAAGFFDPFTGQGIYLALHSATLAATIAHQALSHGDVSAQSLRVYWGTHRHTFSDKYRVSEIIQRGLRWPWLANRTITRLASNPTLADTVVGVTGDFLPPHTVLSWQFATRLLL